MAEATSAKRQLSGSLIAGAGVLGLLALVAILAPPLLGDRAEGLTAAVAQPPSAEHWLGTDSFGRDILARCLVAIRLTLGMSIAATALSTVVGAIIGGITLLLPAKLRDLVLRVIDASIGFPSLILALVVTAILGGGAISAVLGIGIAGIPVFARITSSMTSSLIHRSYVSVARGLGVPPGRLFNRHLLPNMSGPLLVLTASSFTLAILEISALSFVGLGVQSPDFDLGRLLNEGLPKIYTSPLAVVGPSVMLIVTGVGAVLLGDGLAEMLDPRRRSVTKHKAERQPRTVREDVSTPRADTPLVEVRDLLVVASDADHPIVKRISFTINAGEIVGVVGESGSGKSLTAMSLAGLLDDSLSMAAGTLAVDGLDMRRPERLDPSSLARTIGVVFQDPGSTFNPARHLGPQLTEVARLHLGLRAGAADARIVAALRTAQVREPERRLRQYPHELSGGMLQRASIASVIAIHPKLLIADEPTTALDVTVQAEVLRELRAMNRRDGTALLFISHDLGVIGALCDRVLVMKDGEIVERLMAADLRTGTVQHPYTRKLLNATPQLTGQLQLVNGNATR